MKAKLALITGFQNGGKNMEHLNLNRDGLDIARVFMGDRFLDKAQNGSVNNPKTGALYARARA